MKLHIHNTIPRSRVNGPGERFVVWVQGCSTGCIGCFNPEACTLDGGEDVTVDELAERIAATDRIEGVTLSGGEPFQQAAACVALCRRVREAGLSVFAFTGYALAQLERSPDPAVRELVSLIDIMVDGPFVREQKCDQLWRGSANQTVRFLTGRYSAADFDLDSPAGEVEITLNPSGRTRVTGFPNDELETGL